MLPIRSAAEKRANDLITTAMAMNRKLMPKIIPALLMNFLLISLALEYSCKKEDIISESMVFKPLITPIKKKPAPVR